MPLGDPKKKRALLAERPSGQVARPVVLIKEVVRKLPKWHFFKAKQFSTQSYGTEFLDTLYSPPHNFI